MAYGQEQDRAAGNKALTRIQSQIETIKAQTHRVVRLTDLNVEHAHQLGFFSPPSDPNKNGTAMPAPVVSSLDDAIRELMFALDNFDGTMSLFN